jgi:preprotein translocase subunit YajC
MSDVSPAFAVFVSTFAQASQPAVGAASEGPVTGAAAAPVAAPISPVASEVLGQPKAAAPGAVPVGTPAGMAAVPAQPIGGGAPQAQPSMLTFMLPLILVMGVMMLFTFMTGRKEKKKKAELFAAMAPGDKVQTFGGIIGSIAEIKDDEIVLRVDEVNNTRIRFAKSAISGVLRKHNHGQTAELKPTGGKVSA